MNLNKIPEPHKTVLDLLAKSFPTIEKSKIWAILKQEKFDPHEATTILLTLQEEQEISQSRRPNQNNLNSPHSPNKNIDTEFQKANNIQSPPNSKTQNTQSPQSPNSKNIDSEFQKEFERLKANTIQLNGKNKNLLDSSIAVPQSQNKNESKTKPPTAEEIDAEYERLKAAHNNSLMKKSMLDSSVNLSKSRLAEQGSDLNSKVRFLVSFYSDFFFCSCWIIDIIDHFHYSG